MKEEFKIVEEATLDFGIRYDLYLMLIKDNADYFIAVDSRLSRIGKRNVRSLREGETVFVQMEKQLRCYKELFEVVKMLQLAFSLKSIREHMFIVNHLNRTLDFNSIWKLGLRYGCITTPVITDLIFEDKSYNKTIHITFPNRKEAIGYFKAETEAEDSNFIFHLNKKFLHLK